VDTEQQLILPINEVLAAGVLLLSGWDGQGDFQILCVVQGLSLKAAMIACNIPANINRKKEFRKKWHDWDNELFDNITH
jgi:putative N6-adenine-specific DNA methylase